MRKCTVCNKSKKDDEFYQSKGRTRSECKKCCIRRNMAYQKRVHVWGSRFDSDDERRQYMREYYADNKEKFQGYRDKFKAKHPDYYKTYSRKRKSEKCKI